MARSRSLSAGAGIAAGTPFTVGTIPKVLVAGSNPSLDDSVITQGVAGVGTQIRINNAAFPAATEQLQVLGGAIFDSTGSTAASPHDSVLIGRGAASRAVLNARNVVIGTLASSNAGVNSTLNTVIGYSAIVTVDQGSSVVIGAGGGINWTQTAGAAVLIGSGAAAIQFPGVAIGCGITVLGSGTAVGNQLSTSAVNNYCVYGRSAQVNADGQTVVGDGARGVAGHTTSIALGRNTFTSAANQFAVGGGSGLQISQVLIGAGDTQAGGQAVLHRHTNGSGADNAAANIQFQAGLSTGNSASAGRLQFLTGAPGASSSTVQTGTVQFSILPSAGGAGAPNVRWDNVTNGAGALAGTLGNSPVLGDPTFWLPVSIAGTVKYIPCW